MVDDDDYEWLNQWIWSAHIQKSGDVVAVRNIKRNGKSNILYMHRVIMDAPKGMLVDHRDHNTLNNQRENLRVCTHRDNMRNSKSRRYGEYKGVSKCPCSDNFRAYFGGKHLGVFKTKEEAAIAYNEMALKIYGEFALINIIKRES